MPRSKTYGQCATSSIAEQPRPDDITAINI
jgi:hypothetical protein